MKNRRLIYLAALSAVIALLILGYHSDGTPEARSKNSQALATDKVTGHIQNTPSFSFKNLIANPKKTIERALLWTKPRKAG